jgi:agmatinase
MIPQPEVAFMNQTTHLPFRGGYNFLGLPAADSTYEEARAVILPVPYDSTTSYRGGTREGPQAIIMASRNVELYDHELGCEPLSRGVHTWPELEPDMTGPEATVALVEKACAHLLADGKFPVLLGGEHSLTTGPVRALRAVHGDELSILQLDAHADLRESFENTPYSHASVMRCCADPAGLTQVGIRNISAGEMEYVKATKHDGIFWAHDLAGRSATEWVDRVVARLRPKVYITIDLDAFDPAIMPAVGTPEPGGLDWYPVLRLLREVCHRRTIVGFDVMELCPIPGQIAGDFLAAKLVFKLLGMIFAHNGWISAGD